LKQIGEHSVAANQRSAGARVPKLRRAGAPRKTSLPVTRSSKIRRFHPANLIHPPRRTLRPMRQSLSGPRRTLVFMTFVASIRNIIFLAHRRSDESKSARANSHIGDGGLDLRHVASNTSAPGDTFRWCVCSSSVSVPGPFSDIGAWQFRQSLFAGFRNCAWLSVP
jgi:hypothetical protein